MSLKRIFTAQHVKVTLFTDCRSCRAPATLAVSGTQKRSVGGEREKRIIFVNLPIFC